MRASNKKANEAKHIRAAFVDKKYHFLHTRTFEKKSAKDRIRIIHYTLFVRISFEIYYIVLYLCTSSYVFKKIYVNFIADDR